MFRIACRSYSGVRKGIPRRGDGIPKGLDTTLVCRTAAGGRILADDLRLGTRSGPQEMIQLHEGERDKGKEREGFDNWWSCQRRGHSQPRKKGNKGSKETVTPNCDPSVTPLPLPPSWPSFL